MVKITKTQLHGIANCIGATSYDDYCEENSYENLVSDLTYEKISTSMSESDIVLCDECVSELGLGGDDLISMVTQTENLIKAGRTMVYWYGPNGEVLIMGIDGSKVEIVD